MNTKQITPADNIKSSWKQRITNEACKHSQHAYSFEAGYLLKVILKIYFLCIKHLLDPTFCCVLDVSLASAHLIQMIRSSIELCWSLVTTLDFNQECWSRETSKSCRVWGAPRTRIEYHSYKWYVCKNKKMHFPHGPYKKRMCSEDVCAKMKLIFSVQTQLLSKRVVPELNRRPVFYILRLSISLCHSTLSCRFYHG